MTAASWRVDVDDATTSAVYEPAIGAERAVFVCAHGAGGNMNDRAMLGASKALRSVGLGVVRFNFLYKEKGKGGPDRMPKLMECFAAVVERARKELSPAHVIIGGRSMGGRAGSMLAAERFEADALLLLAYPLHPPGRHDQLRDEHLPAITIPVLCFNGTRDTFCDPELMKGVLKKLKNNWTMHWLDAADHGFHVPKSSGRTDAAVLEEVAAETRAWLDKIGL
jgi:predicted alpha/beta-hydrolase family hydrolase